MKSMILAILMASTMAFAGNGPGDVGSVGNATVRISTSYNCDSQNLSDYHSGGVCGSACTGGWHPADPAVCGACQAGAGFSNAGMSLAQASQLCVQTLRNSANTLIELHQKGLLDETSLKSGEAENALVSICIGAAARYRVQCVLQ